MMPVTVAHEGTVRHLYLWWPDIVIWWVWCCVDWVTILIFMVVVDINRWFMMDDSVNCIACLSWQLFSHKNKPDLDINGNNGNKHALSGNPNVHVYKSILRIHRPLILCHQVSYTHLITFVNMLKDSKLLKKATLS